jgi:LAO/AO transport system kinase
LEPAEIAGLFDEARAGSRGALARLLTMVERGGPDARAVSAVAYPVAGAAHSVGITGAPGSGKSTLVAAVCSRLRTLDRRVGVVAIDPSSPFSGGAILGDRVRMTEHGEDADVFIRSMATRGHLGGLSVATPGALAVLDAVGFDPVVVETVGVGQVEVEIVGLADTCVVVVNPGWGDAVQANKAGLMEIADIFVINKADRAGAADTRRDLESMLSLRPGGEWTPPVVSTRATEGDGVNELVDHIARHRAHLAGSPDGARRRLRRLRHELAGVIAAELAQRAAALSGTGPFDRAVEALEARTTDPWSAASDLIAATDRTEF